MSEPRYALDDFNPIPGYGIGDNSSPEDRDSWLPLNLAYLPDQPPVQPTLGDVGLVYPGKRHVFSGPQESAKTLAAYVIGLRIVRADGTIILIDFEMGAYDARNRLRELGATPDDLERIHYLEPDQPATIERIHRLIALAPQLVIIDAAAGAYNLQGLDDNKRADAEKIAGFYIRGFWRNNIATIMLDHVVKNSETRGSYAIGSERKVGGADVHLGFETITPISRGSRGIYRIVNHKDRGGYLKRGALADLHLSSDPETHAIECELKPVEHVEPGETWLPTIVMQKISGLLEQQDEPQSRNVIIGLAGGNKERAAQAIDHLIRLHYAQQDDGPNRSKLLTHTKAFTILDWESKEHDPVPPGSPRVTPEPPIYLVVPPGSPRFPQNYCESGSPVPLSPTGEGGEPTTAENNPVPPGDWSWVEELTHKENGEQPDDLTPTTEEVPF